MTKKKYWIIGAIIIVGGGYYWYSKTHSATQPVQYVTTAAVKGMLTVSVSGSGQVEAVNQVDLKSVAAGDAINVVAVYVKNDQLVKTGSLVALLDTADAQKAIRNAELDLESTQNKYTQSERDYKKDLINKLSLQAQRISVDQKENALADAKEKLNDYSIRAPFDGIVTNLSVGAGDSVSRSDIIASIITSDVHAKVVINELDAGHVAVGEKAILTFNALPNISITGKVTKIDTIGAVSQGVVTYNAEISLDVQNNLLKPGMSVSASIITGIKQDVIIVPNSAVKTQGDGSNYVEVLNSGTVPQQVNVQVGAVNNTDTGIVSGVNEGDKVVTRTVNPGAASAASTTSGQGAAGGLRIPGVGGGGTGGGRGFGG